MKKGKQTRDANQLTLFSSLEESATPANSKNDSKASPDTYKGRYAMHKYWSKKPHNLVANYIERFSNQNEIVLDSFCGSGVTVIESVRLKRRAIGVDINPIATLCTRFGLERIEERNLQADFLSLQKKVENVFNTLYVTTCPICGNQNATVTHAIWNNNELTQLWVSCDACQTKKAVKSPGRDDIHLAMNPPLEVTSSPTQTLIENYRINAKRGTRVSDLFTPRALSGLSYLLDKIRELDDPKSRAAFEFCFSAALPQASNMVFVIKNRGKANGESSDRIEIGSWVIGYWTPAEHFEINVWRCFENRFRRILKGFHEINALIPAEALEYTSPEELLVATQGYFIKTGNATQLPLPAESVDYVFIDPPHGNRIPYLELSLMWNSWLGFDTDWENEIVISEAKSRGKNIADFEQRLQQAFNEIWRVLKPNRFTSLVFNSLDDETWLSILNACLQAGFEVESIEPLEYSARSVVQDNRKNALKTDFVINLRKSMPRQSRSISFNNSNNDIEALIKAYLRVQGKGAETYELLNSLTVNSLSKGTMYRVSDILNTLEQSFTFHRGRWNQTEDN